MVYRLDERLIFPDPHWGEPDGLIAVGGDLSPERLLLAYSHGIFPWYSFRDSDICWFCPLQRFVIFPAEIHVSHSMRTLMRKDRYKVRFNTDFEQTIRHCSELRFNQIGAWLGDDMINAYTELYRRGYAMSVEVWEGDSMVGGLYGVTLGRNFFGESMFSLVPSASKLALISLARQMEKNNLGIIDCQLETPHLKSMGARFISYEAYMELIGPKDVERGDKGKLKGS